MACCIIKYDKKNTQKPFTYMARKVGSNEAVIGYVVIEKPWYSPESMWKYFIEYNDYRSGGFCGGCIDLGLKRVEIQKDTIIPFNQLAEIKLNQENGFDTKLEGDDLPGFRTEIVIKANSRIPEDLWKWWFATAGIETLAKYNRYGATVNCQEVPFKRDTEKDIIAENMAKERNKLFAAISNFWEENKEEYKSIIVGLSGGEYDYEVIEEVDGNVGFTHSLTAEYFSTFEDCCLDFVKEVNPDDVAGFNTGTVRKKVK